MTHSKAWPLAAALLGLSLSAGAAPAAEPATNAWRQMLRQDLAFAHDTIASRYIYARTPGGPAFDKLLADADRQAAADGDKVSDIAGYQAVMRRYLGSFADAHLGVRLNVEPARLAWPRFLVRYHSGRYVVVESATPAVRVGATISACDGKPIAELVSAVAPELGRGAGAERGLETTRDAIAHTLFVDARNPLYPRPARCQIDGQDVALNWTPIGADQLAVRNAPHDLMRDPVTAISSFGAAGARVRMATFGPGTLEEAQQFHAIIDAAPSLRDKAIVVFDVRGNPGGSYNWFTGFLEAFYGPTYADHYAIARLKIRPVFIDQPGGSLAGKPGATPPAPRERADPFNTPPDKAMDGLLTGFEARPAAHGATVWAAKMGPLPAAALAPAPPNPVHARVFVLTDYACASACIAFVDELKRFPGVLQVGRETAVDSLTGTPLTYPLPSGNGDLSVPSLVRENRERGDNIPQRPDIAFDGDIADTAAVLSWIQTLPEKAK
ncbi:MAG: hypothetical protein ACXWKN_07595 [Phenylobacterium sp.]